LFDDAAAEADVAVISDHRLSRRDRPLRFVKGEAGRVSAGQGEMAGGILLAIACLGGIGARAVRCAAADPGITGSGLALMHFIVLDCQDGATP